MLGASRAPPATRDLMAFAPIMHTQHNIGRAEPPPLGLAAPCAGCDKPILDKFLLNVLERGWHASCVRCCDCLQPLTDKCFSREAKLFCRNDFFRRYGTKCSGCGQGIAPSDLVRKPRDKVFHLNCFTCLVCRKQLSTGEQLYVLDDNKFVCKDDYLTGKANSVAATESLMGSASEDEDDDDLPGSNPRLSGGLGSAGSLLGSAGAGAGLLGSGLIGSDAELAAMNADSKTGMEDSEDQTSLDGDVLTGGNSGGGNSAGGDSAGGGKSPAGDDEAGGGSKRRGPRTTIKAKQLEILKTAFGQTPKPTRHIREQLAKETGLPMRVIQVWFQNKRSKERRLKQLTSMGRGPFFGGSRKMRGFPMNLSPHEDSVGGGVFPPYFDKFEFAGLSYPPGFHHHGGDGGPPPHFFGGPPVPPQGGMHGVGGPGGAGGNGFGDDFGRFRLGLDRIHHHGDQGPGGMGAAAMMGDFEGAFMNPSGGGGGGGGPMQGGPGDHMGGPGGPGGPPRGGGGSSPEFMGGGGGGGVPPAFSEPQNMHSEGLVW